MNVRPPARTVALLQAHRIRLVVVRAATTPATSVSVNGPTNRRSSCGAIRLAIARRHVIETVEGREELVLSNAQILRGKLQRSAP